jgi:alkylated DNA repair dioxygenase AlkB
MALHKSPKVPSLSTFPTLGPGDSIGEGDTFILYDLIPEDTPDPNDPANLLRNTIFDLLKNEVAWQKMYHAAGEVPRLVAVQGLVDDQGNKPLYRHPSDQSPPLNPFTKTVSLVKTQAELAVGHELNHVLIQLYRDGKDHITEHSDKTLDIARDTKIVNASFGARRTMRLRGKRIPIEDQIEPDGPRERNRSTQRVHMPHNSLFVLGPATNASWLHGIPADKRTPDRRTAEELAFEGARVSLTFRLIGTFLDREETKIWGQGAKEKEKEKARDVVIGDESETERMIRAFAEENTMDEGRWNWEEAYGAGFDVLHFRKD